MTEHKKIPLPEDGDESKTGKAGESSLFERASGAFGLDSFGSAPMPGKLADAPMKRARPVRRKPATEQAGPAVTDREPDHGASAARANDQAAPEETGSADTETPAEERASSVPAVQKTHAPATIEARGYGTPFTGKPVSIDRDILAKNGLINPKDGNSALLEEFRIVKRHVLEAARDRGTSASRRILISSPHPDEGKTYCAINLAIALAAERDLEILLVDADFAKPSLPDMLGIPASTGFMDALSNDDCDVEDHVIGTDIGNLWVLPSGNQTNADSEYLASNRTQHVLDRLTMGHPDRLVIFDTPPALAASTAAELAKHVGQAILVARAEQTGRTALEDSYRLLSACDDIKMLLNATNFSPSGRRFGSYYK
ncbi:AAA family ATPase [Altererythrobacter sp. MTPC7]|uniref:AAA family ATPase n=1 Tax=Altererythrobacter sp. MTPC7 TaxID=3056567 RepID=UPI0036F1A354